ncbi:MAG: hypothetical protein CBC13_07875 [Planctomycetia bacterium TMED53]|nr:MAG: hypothetical protein CBC13_07875 [Planctomycetia bacterium TMED53]
MTHWIAGLDEAGYGPWLGPMVIGFVSLKAEKGTPASAPWDHVANLGRAGRREKGIISVADSKKLHRPGKGDLTRLEEAVLAFTTLDRGEMPETFRDLVQHLTAGRSEYLDIYPWYRDQDLPLPFSAEPIDLAGKCRKLERGLESARLELGEIRAIPLEVQEFNSEVDSRGSKGAVDAWAMGRFLHWLWMIEDRQSIEVWTDRLGGRERYGPFLYPLFPGCQFKILEQNKDAQSYQASNAAGKTLEVHFRKECEDHSFCTALASMTAKYLRELHMVLLNRWWSKHLPDLKPTAGYPQDARRFISEVEPIRDHLGIDRKILVRSR